MKILIENYRGWDISFDPDKEEFYCHSEGYDKDDYKKSFSGVKKFIDDFIKDNTVFAPVVVQKLPGSYGGGNKVKLIGIRKDKRFIYEDNSGIKKQISDYDEKDYIIYDAANDIHFLEAENIQIKINALVKAKEEELKKVTGTSLVEYKKQLGL